MSFRKLPLFLLLCCISTLLHASNFWTDEGNYSIDWYSESASTFEISNASQLAGVAFLANIEGINFGGKTFFMTNDIDLAGHEWVAIANVLDSTVFSGTFEGNNHRILNMVIKDQPFSNTYGLIGYAINAKVQNLIIDSTCQLQGNNRTSGIVAHGIYVTVNNCRFEGKANGSWYVSGIVGYGYAVSISNCVNTGTLIGDGYVGGIIGTAYKSPIENCTNEGFLSGYNSVGGIVGFFGGPVALTNCSSNGPVEGSYNTGGLVGKSYEFSVIQNSYNNAPVVCFVQNAGGVVASAGELTNFYNCYNFGDIEGVDVVGGIVGEMSDSTSFNNCYNAANLHGSDRIGGIAGICIAEVRQSFIRNCYNVGKVSGSSNFAGLIASAGAYFEALACYYLDTCVDGSNNYGEPLTSDYMQSADFVEQLNSIATAYNQHDTLATWLEWGCSTNPNYLYPVHAALVDVPHNSRPIFDFELYPNPASNYFNIKSSENHSGMVVRVYAVDGLLKFTKQFDSPQMQVDVSNWKSGLYIVTVVQNERVVGFRRIIVK